MWFLHSHDIGTSSQCVMSFVSGTTGATIFIFREQLCKIIISRYFMVVLISWLIASQRLFFSFKWSFSTTDFPLHSLWHLVQGQAVCPTEHGNDCDGSSSKDVKTYQSNAPITRVSNHEPEPLLKCSGFQMHEAGRCNNWNDFFSPSAAQSICISSLLMFPVVYKPVMDEGHTDC